MITGSTVASVHILGAAFFSTHHASAQDLLAGRERPFAPPSYSLLVGRARRFTSLVTQMHIEVCAALPAARGPSPVGSLVFATCHGEIQTAEKLIADLRETSMVSSARFALSVHNTASGVYSVALGSTAPTTTITGANAIAAGWLEAALTALDHAGSTVLLSIADEPVPAVFRGPAQPVGVAAAFLLAAVPAAAPAAASAAAGDRRVELAVVPAIGEPEVNPLDVLARAADGWAREDAAAVALGRIQPGAALELRFPAKDARA